MRDPRRRGGCAEKEGEGPLMGHLLGPEVS